mmetsp:Transcript_14916/g.36595  ORF Transcript_14916/g.36595 Transcript_14916/m.36595 type:complete len:304 (-) Transcript_14916:144-1055(-)
MLFSTIVIIIISTVIDLDGVRIQGADAFSIPQTSGGSYTTDACTSSWRDAKMALRSQDCCVVFVSGLETHLQILQASIANNGPMDVDLRTRIRAGGNNNCHLEQDCLKLQQSILGNDHNDTAVTTAFMEIARGAVSLADGPLESVCTDVFLRVVCASDYKARDPMFHTDKCPIRGYVTLRGVGTEFSAVVCNPLQYATLRSLGADIGRGNDDHKNLRQANELELIVMKGDHYQSNIDDAKHFKWWARESACVHRSPPGSKTGGRRVILSFDLAAGEDDREWYEIDKRREWRSGMTQRKSRLVA